MIEQLEELTKYIWDEVPEESFNHINPPEWLEQLVNLAYQAGQWSISAET